jgi:hypothetical protein
LYHVVRLLSPHLPTYYPKQVPEKSQVASNLTMTHHNTYQYLPWHNSKNGLLSQCLNQARLCDCYGPTQNRSSTHAHDVSTHCVVTMNIPIVSSRWGFTMWIPVVMPHCGYSLSIPIEDTHLGTCPLPFLPCSEATQRNRTQLETLFGVANPATFLLQNSIYSWPIQPDCTFPFMFSLFFPKKNYHMLHP